MRMKVEPLSHDFKVRACKIPAHSGRVERLEMLSHEDGERPLL